MRADGRNVHLDGGVATFTQKAAVENAGQRVKGVRGDVKDLVDHRCGDALSDDAVAARVANLLDGDVTLPMASLR